MILLFYNLNSLLNLKLSSKLNIIHESMCIFEISTIDPAVFAHCSLRLGLTFESLANVNSKKLTKGIEFYNNESNL